MGYIEMGSTEIGNKDVKWMKLLQDYVKDWVVKCGVVDFSSLEPEML